MRTATTQKATMNDQSVSYVMSFNEDSGDATVVKRIRTPHKHDVLCGRGGGINSHPGNETFRNWVHERKNVYNLASNKAEKARVSREIVNMVQNLSPPGRFLQRESTITGAGSTSISGWWVEIDDAKAMAKTSQALREGAPSIRAEYQKLHDGGVNVEAAALVVPHRPSRKRTSNIAITGESDSKQQKTKSVLTARLFPHNNQDSSESPHFTRLSKKRRNLDGAKTSKRRRQQQQYELNNVNPYAQTPPLSDETPPLDRVPTIDDITPQAEIENMSTIISQSCMVRNPSINSLAISDIGVENDCMEFVNPFENETDEQLSRLAITPDHDEEKRSNGINHHNSHNSYHATSSSLPGVTCARSPHTTHRTKRRLIRTVSNGSHGDLGGIGALFSGMQNTSEDEQQQQKEELRKPSFDNGITIDKLAYRRQMSSKVLCDSTATGTDTTSDKDTKEVIAASSLENQQQQKQPTQNPLTQQQQMNHQKEEHPPQQNQEDKILENASKNCFCLCGRPLEEGSLCMCGDLANHLMWRDDAIPPDEVLRISGFYDQIVPINRHQNNKEVTT